MINIVFYFFIIGSIIGWLLEIVFKVVTKSNNIDAGILNGPFCILYGIGITFMSVILSKVTNVFVIFILCTFFMSLFEYVTDYLLEKIYGIRLWDYSNCKFNIRGRICISFSLAWGLLGTFYVKLIFPYLLNFYLNVNNQILNIAIYTILVYIVLDFCVSSVKLLINKRQNNIYSV